MVEQRKPAAVPKAKKIMIVDDDPFCCSLVQMMLESLGQECDTANNGKEGVSLYQKNCKGYKGILMDFHMPEVDGFQATKQIRTLEKYLGFHVPVIGLTGDDIASHPELKQQAITAGMNDVMTKPVNVMQLQSFIETLGK